MNIDVYYKLKKNSDPLIKDFRADLVQHDYNDIRKSEHCSLLHFTRESGTHLVKLSTEHFPSKNVEVPYLFGTADRNHILKGLLEVVKHCKSNCVLTQYYSHVFDEVYTISSDMAMCIVQEYIKRVREQWRNEK